MAIEIFKLFGRILVDDKEAQKSLSRTDKNVKTFGDRLRGGIKTAAKWGTAIVGAATTAGAAMFGLVNKATQAADAIAKGAERVGVSTDFYQEMEFWASQNGLSHEQMEKAVGRFNQRLGQAVNGNEKYASALQQVGIDLDAVRNGQLSTEDAYAQTIQRLSEMENEQDKVNLATEIFGTRLARDMLPALNEGSLSIEEARKKAQELGLVISEDQLRASEQFQDSWDQIKRSMGTAATQIGLVLMPAFQSVMDFILDNVIPVTRELWGAFQEGEGVIGGIKNVFSELTSGEGLSGLIDMARDAFNNLVTWLAGEGIPMLLDGMMQSREMFFNAAMTLFPAIIEAAVEFLPQFLEWITGTFIPQLITFILEGIPMLIEAGIQLFNSLVTAINTVLPMLIDILFNVFLPNLLTTILNMLPSVLNSAIQLFTALLDAVMAILPQLLALLLGTVLPNLLTTILGMIPQLLSAAIQLFLALLDAILAVLPQLLTLLLTVVLPNVLSTLISMIPQLLSTAIQVFLALLDGLIQVVPQLINFIIFDLIPALLSAFTQIDMIQVGKDIIRGLWNGISSLSEWIKEKVSGFISGIGDTIKSFFGISSPAKLTIEYGKNITQGLAVGVEDEEDKAIQAVDSVSRSMLDAGVELNNMTQQNERSNFSRFAQYDKQRDNRRPVEVHLHIGSFIGDKQGLKQLERMLRQIRIEENGRLGVQGV